MVWHASMVLSSNISPPSIWTCEFTSRLTVSNLIHELFVIGLNSILFDKSLLHKCNVIEVRNVRNCVSFKFIIIIYRYESTVTAFCDYIIGSLNFLTSLIVFTFSLNLFQRKWTFDFGKFPKWLICSLRSTYSRFYNWNVYWIKWIVAFFIWVTYVSFTEPSSKSLWVSLRNW